MILLINFNENNASRVHDYSTSGNHSTSVTGLTINSGDIGLKGVFDGSTTDVNFGDISEMEGVQKLSIHAKIKASATKTKRVIVHKGSIELGIDSNDKIYWSIQTTNGTKTVRTSEKVDNTWITVTGVYDGSNIKIYYNTSEQDSDTQETNINDTGNDLQVGTDGSAYYDGDIEEVRVFDIALTSNNITELHNNQTGVETPCEYDHLFQEGDLIAYDAFGTAVQRVVTLKEDEQTFYSVPLNANRVTGGELFHRYGNAFDEARQGYISMRTEHSSGATTEVIEVRKNISKFSDLTSEDSIAAKLAEEPILRHKKYLWFSAGNDNVIGFYEGETITGGNSANIQAVMPDELHEIISFEVFINPDLTREEADIDFEVQIHGDNEVYNTHTNSDTSSNYSLTQNQTSPIDISSLLDSANPGDLIGVKVTDNETDDIRVLGSKLTYR